MGWWTAARFWVRSRFRGRALRAEIDEELAYHVAMRTAELEADGVESGEARRLALETFGSVERVRHACRDLYMVDAEEGEGTMGDVLQDVRFGLRSLGRRPAFTAAVICTLALGIGANSAIFSVLDGVLLKPLPYDRPSELVRLWQADRVNGTRFENFSLPDYFDVMDRSAAFSSAAALELRTPTLSGPGESATRLSAVAASHTFARTLGLPMSLGRWFTPDEDLPGGERVAVLGHAFWLSHFGGDEGVVGSPVRLDGLAYQIVGVAPAALDFPQPNVQVWMPLQMDRGSRPRNQHNFRVVARLADEVSLDRANAGLGAVAAALAEEYPVDNGGREMWSQSLHESVVGNVSSALYLLAAGVGLVLLIAAVNVANLLFVRGAGRAHEVAIRMAMGAPRGRLMRQLLTEHLLLGLLGGMAGLGVSWVGVRALVALGPASLPRIESIGVDGPVLLFTLCITLVTALLSGLAPAMRSARVRFRTSLAGGSRGGGLDSRANRLGRGLVVAQVGMAVVLVSVAGLLVDSMSHLRSVDPGFEPNGVLSASMELPATRYAQPRAEWPDYPEVLAFQHELVDRAGRLPGVTSVGLAMNGPTDPGWTTGFSAELVSADDIEPTEEVRIRIISAGYPETIGMELVRGRFPDPSDDRFETPPVALINEAMAKRYFSGVDPIGSWISNWGIRREIIGVVRDVRFMGLGAPAEPAVYPLFAHMPLAGFSVLVRTTGDPAALASPLRSLVAEIDPDLALGSVGAVSDMLSATSDQLRFNALLLSLFALLSVVLASVGIYGVIAQGVSQRAHEIGVRMSLGASGREVALGILRESMALTGLGLLVGLAATLASSELLRGLLFDVQPSDPANFLRVSVVAAIVGMVAALVPARRASRVDPMRTVTGR